MCWREVAGRLLGGCKEVGGKMPGSWREVLGRLWGGCWEALKRLLGRCREAGGKLEGGCWEVVTKLTIFAFGQSFFELRTLHNFHLCRQTVETMQRL